MHGNLSTVHCDSAAPLSEARRRRVATSRRRAWWCRSRSAAGGTSAWVRSATRRRRAMASTTGSATVTATRAGTSTAVSSAASYLCAHTQPHIKSKKRLTAIHLISSYTLLLAIVNTSWLVVYCIRFLLNVPTIDNALYTYTYDLNDWVGY